jgi:hypothetical protein
LVSPSFTVSAAHNPVVSDLSGHSQRASANTGNYFSWDIDPGGVGLQDQRGALSFLGADVYEGGSDTDCRIPFNRVESRRFCRPVATELTIFPVLSSGMPCLLAAMAVASLVAGNLLALNQSNFKRFLAYSSIAQAGYILVGVAASSTLGIAGVAYYLMAYLVTNLVAFAIASVVSRVTGTDEISGLAGLSQRKPFLGFALLISLLSSGWDTTIRRFHRQAAGIFRGNSSWPGLAGGDRCLKFRPQPVLLPAGVESRLPGQTA